MWYFGVVIGRDQLGGVPDIVALEIFCFTFLCTDGVVVTRAANILVVQVCVLVVIKFNKTSYVDSAVCVKKINAVPVRGTYWVRFVPWTQKL